MKPDQLAAIKQRHEVLSNPKDYHFSDVETCRGQLARDDIPALLAYCESLEAQLEKIKKHERDRWENAYKTLGINKERYDRR